MSETIPFSSSPATLRDSRTCLTSRQIMPPTRPQGFRGRIGADAAGGFYAAPHRYQLYLCPGCPHSLRVAITLHLLGLKETVPVTLVENPAEQAGLRRAYEATWHHYDGPLTAPALCDRWSGRVVSNHTPDILRDLAGPLRGRSGVPCLRPPSLAADIDALRDLVGEEITGTAALEQLDHRLAARPYVLGDVLTAADVDVWVALVHLDTVQGLHQDTPVEQLVSGYGRLSDYVRRLHRHPAFHDSFSADHMTRLHRRTCPACSG